MAQLQQLQGFAIALKYAYRAIIGSKGDYLVSPGRRAICRVERNKMRKDNDIFRFAQRYQCGDNIRLPCCKIDAGGVPGRLTNQPSFQPSHGATTRCAPPNPRWEKEFQQHAAPQWLAFAKWLQAALRFRGNA
ncbi:MAG: hypothetical protein CM15mP21_2660 [Hyphomicrobiales bacterium]|nr:MAG: hypothetical protein CM15mP21_2660 [Hyphomicrobiales bacterium]